MCLRAGKAMRCAVPQQCMPRFGSAVSVFICLMRLYTYLRSGASMQHTSITWVCVAVLYGPVTQPGQSGRLLTSKSWVRIPPGPHTLNPLRRHQGCQPFKLCSYYSTFYYGRSIIAKRIWACGVTWIARQLPELLAAGSNPAMPEFLSGGREFKTLQAHQNQGVI